MFVAVIRNMFYITDLFLNQEHKLCVERIFNGFIYNPFYNDRDKLR